MNEARRLPVTLIGGYLGSGKTTLVNHLLRAADGRRLAVLVNDFGDINIDADLIESRDGGVINLAGGCVCCSFGSDLMGTLLEVGRMTPAPDQVLIETSGVALPAAVARALRLAPGLTLDATLVMADAETLHERATDHYVGDTVLAQLRDADLIVINKVDLVDAQALESLIDWLARTAPQASYVEVERAALDPEFVFADLKAGASDSAATPAAAAATAGRTSNRAFATRPMRRSAAAGSASERFESVSLEFDGRVDARKLGQALADENLGLFRAKGIMSDSDGRRVSLQVVGRRFEIAARTGESSEKGRLVCIGASNKVQIESIRACLNAALSTH